MARETLAALQDRVRWRPGKLQDHLTKRIAFGHLPSAAGPEDYQNVIRNLLHDGENVVYSCSFGQSEYFAVAGMYAGRAWVLSHFENP